MSHWAFYVHPLLSHKRQLWINGLVSHEPPSPDRLLTGARGTRGSQRRRSRIQPVELGAWAVGAWDQTVALEASQWQWLSSAALAEKWLWDGSWKSCNIRRDLDLKRQNESEFIGYQIQFLTKMVTKKSGRFHKSLLMCILKRIAIKHQRKHAKRFLQIPQKCFSASLCFCLFLFERATKGNCWIDSVLNDHWHSGHSAPVTNELLWEQFPKGEIKSQPFSVAQTSPFKATVLHNFL